MESYGSLMSQVVGTALQARPNRVLRPFNAGLQQESPLTVKRYARVAWEGRERCGTQSPRNQHPDSVQSGAEAFEGYLIPVEEENAIVVST
jgi:hypothetical protein